MMKRSELYFLAMVVAFFVGAINLLGGDLGYASAGIVLGFMARELRYYTKRDEDNVQ